jgi:hypothetical protein
MSIKRASYQKILSSNDTGKTGTHQAGILIPKSEAGLLDLFPRLDQKEYNPSTFITASGSGGERYNLRFIYYNSKLHGTGTRNEYRLTHLTEFLRLHQSKPGDFFRITRDENGCLTMEVVKEQSPTSTELPNDIRLRGWSRVC